MNNKLLFFLCAVITIVLAMVLESFELLWGDWYWLAPSWAFVLLLFWSSNYSGLFNVGFAWFFGLVMDAWLSTPLGQHALLFLLGVFFISFTYNNFKDVEPGIQCLIVGLMTLVYKLFIVTIAFDLDILLSKSIFLYLGTAISSAILWLLLGLIELNKVSNIR